MNKTNSVIRFLASVGLLMTGVIAFNACSNDDPKPLQTIITFSPASAVQGATVVITGTNFSTTASKNIVAFNGTPAVVTNATATQLTTTVPVGTTTGKITVQLGAKIVTSSDDFVYVPTVSVSTLAGSVGGFANETGTAAKFQYPTGVATDAAGNVYVADWENNRIRKITPDGTATTFAGKDITGTSDGTGTAAEFAGPYGLAIDATGNIYVADTYNHTIRKITPNGVVSTLAGSTNGFAEGTGTGAQFSYPIGVAVDDAGNLYVADAGNLRIRKITSDGVVSTLAGDGTEGSVDGTGSDARFNDPNGVAVDGSGNVYVADYSNNSIRKITSAGIVTTLAGGTSGSTDGTGTVAQFNGPSGVAVDASGNVYVADRMNNRVRKITSTGEVTTLAGSVIGFADGIGSVVLFNSLQGVGVDASGNIYVADSKNNRIRKITIQ